MRVYATDFGAIGDGITKNTKAVADALAYLKSNGGGELIFSKGEYISGCIKLIDNLTLVMEEGAVLKASGDIADHYFDEKYENYWLHYYFIYGYEVKNIHITGPGTIDGCGINYWSRKYRSGADFGKRPDRPILFFDVLEADVRRPVMIYLAGCQNIQIDNILLRDSAAYTVWGINNENVKIDKVTIRNHRFGPNTDALDMDCSRNVTITNCDIDAGDDCVAIKSDPHRYGKNTACENIRVENCKFSTVACAIRIGYEGDAPIRNISFKNIEIVNSRHGIDMLSLTPVCAIKVEHGTPIDDIVFENFTMRNVGQAFFIWAGNEEDRCDYAGHIRNLKFKNMDIEAVGSSFIGSQTENIITGLDFENVRMHVADIPETEAVTDFSQMPSLWGDWYKCGGLRFFNMKEEDAVMKNCEITCDQAGFGAIEKTTQPNLLKK